MEKNTQNQPDLLVEQQAGPDLIGSFGDLLMADGFMPQIGQPVQFSTLRDFARPGVYFLYLNGAVVYVGQAGNVRHRLGTHIAEGVKGFDAASCLPCSRQDLYEIERFFICKFVPAYNRCSLSAMARTMQDAGATDAERLALIGDQPKPLMASSAASFLGISRAEFEGLGDRGPRSTHKRVGRNRDRVRLYSLASLCEFLQSGGSVTPIPEAA